MELRTLVANVLAVEADSLSDASDATNTPNWDSVRHIDVLLAVEAAYDVQFALTELNTMNTLGDMRQILEGKGAALAA